MTNKTRNLSTAEYFQKIQEEYLIADFRRKIHFNPKDKRYWSKVMEYKKEKILDISNRNNLISIFSDENVMKSVRNRIFKNGKPVFELTESDVDKYYSTGNEFSYGGEVWMLDYINDSGMAILYSKEKEIFKEVSKEDITRIF